jgi:uncharacterized damage-inducible protein DinB
MSIVDGLLSEFDHEMTTTRKVLERVPEDKFEWRPHERATALGDLAQHVATIPMWGSMTVNQTELVFGDRQPERFGTRAEILAAFDKNAADTRAALIGKADAEFMVPWSLKAGDKTLFSMPRIVVWRSFVMSHLIHHRGQLTVYLRMLDVRVPSIYGPSGDESPF